MKEPTLDECCSWLTITAQQFKGTMTEVYVNELLKYVRKKEQEDAGRETKA